MRLIHYYHVFADAHWHHPFTEHFAALSASGLMDALDEIRIGIVGCEENRDEVKRCLPSKARMVIEACSGYEQVTLGAIDTSEPCYIFYAHTKGASSPDMLRVAWRKSMTNGCVYGWRTCVDTLDLGYDAVGCYWQEAPNYHFSGTFWWATSDYILTLPEQSHSSRFDAEMWIGKGSKGGKFGDLCPGFISYVNILELEPGTSGLVPFRRQYTIRPRTNMGYFKKGQTYILPASDFLTNCIKAGHYEVLDINDDPVKTFFVVR